MRLLKGDDYRSSDEEKDASNDMICVGEYDIEAGGEVRLFERE